MGSVFFLKYECHQCGAKFTRSYALRKHLEERERISLPISRKRITRNLTYADNEEESTRSVLVCVVCRVFATSIEQLKKHFEDEHQFDKNETSGAEDEYEDEPEYENGMTDAEQGLEAETEMLEDEITDDDGQALETEMDMSEDEITNDDRQALENEIVIPEDEITDDDRQALEAEIVMPEDYIEEQFRSVFLEDEYNEGSSAEGVNVHVEMQYDNVYRQVHELVNKTRQSLSERNNVLHPMRYSVIDLTGRHAPSRFLLDPWYNWLQADFHKVIGYQRYQMTEKEKELLMGRDVNVANENEYQVETLARLCDAYGDNLRQTASKQTHILHHLAHFLNSVEVKEQQWAAEWGEITFNASAVKQRCDYLLTYKGHPFSPEVLMGEVSGGLPADANLKAWHDLLIKLVLGSRASILRVMNHLDDEQGKTFVMYNFQLQGFHLRVYATGYVYGMWRVMMLDECYIPSNSENKESRIETYCILKGLMDAVRKQAYEIRKLLNKKAYDV